MSKPFNYAEAVEEGIPIVTSDGLEVVELLDYNFSNGDSVGVIVKGPEGASFRSYDRAGESESGSLHMKAVEHTGWVNIFSEDSTFKAVSEEIYESKEEAERVAGYAVVATTLIKWEV